MPQDLFDSNTLRRLALLDAGAQPYTATDPVAPVDGQIWVRSDTGNLTWRAGGVTYPTVWTNPTFTNSWVNFGGGYQVARYRKVGEIVEIEGLISTGTIGLAAFTLPVGFRPQANHQFAQVSNAVFGNLVVLPTGAVTPNAGSNASFQINCRFSVLP
jgi:hypothetical protein